MSAIRATGAVPDDGLIQLTFTLRTAVDERGASLALEFARQQGLRDPVVYDRADSGGGYTRFVVFGVSDVSVDVSTAHIPQSVALSHEQIEGLVSTFGAARVVGATLGSDAHSVGLDAILNLKGYAGEKGLESYDCFEVTNLGSQVDPADLVEHIQTHGADVVLVSQVVTDHDLHRQHLTVLVDMLEAASLRSNVLLAVGGPRITQDLASELGYDAGFGVGTKPNAVASWIATEWVRLRQRGSTVERSSIE